MNAPVAKPFVPPAAPVEVLAATTLDGLVFRQELRSGDVAAIRRLTRDSGFFTDAEVDVAEELAIDRVENGERSDYCFTVAEIAGAVIAYASYGPIACTQGSFDLYWIVVSKRHQGSGIGRRLMQECERMAVLEGARRMYVETSSREQYLPTRAFYERCGYHAEATLEDFYAPGDGKVMYVKALSAE